MLAQGLSPAWTVGDIAALMAAEKAKLESLKADGYSALSLLRGALRAELAASLVVNNKQILTLGLAFFPVSRREPSFILTVRDAGYGLPAAIGAAFAVRESGGKERVYLHSAGDGGFQHAARLADPGAVYDSPVKTAGK